MNHAGQLAIVLIGVIVPAAFVLFVIAVTRRGREFEKLDGLFAAVSRLQKDLHSAFAADKEGRPSKH